MLHWPQGRVAGLHVCKKGMQHSLTVACCHVLNCDGNAKRLWTI